MRFTDLAYRAAVRAVRLATPALAHGDSKLARGLRGRRGSAARIIEWAVANRDGARPLIWLHAPSVGEGLQARAVLDALKARDPGVQTLFTHFSPSAEPLARRIGADYADYLPWDVRAELGAVLDALVPSLLAFTKTEVWPVLSEEAEARGIPMALIGASLPSTSSRLAPAARPFIRPAYTRLMAVHAVGQEDVPRFALLGVPPERVTVTGDPGVDSAADRVTATDPEAPHIRVFREPATAHGRPSRERRPRLVAGSTWPPDDNVVLAACRLLREGLPKLQLVLVPHEPDAAHVQSLLTRLREEGWPAATLSEVEAAGSAQEWGAVVVDRVGVLVQLYTVASFAYVGGGFHHRGLHSVLEPAAAGAPVCFGPRHHGAHAAERLVRAGAARVVAGAGPLFQELKEWMEDEPARRAAGQAAAEYIAAQRGAAARSARMLLELMRR